MELNELDEYFMKPTKMSNGLLVYPINILNYNEFKSIANDTILFTIKDLDNLQHSNYEKQKKEKLIDRKTKYVHIKEDNLYDYLINKINIDLAFNDKINKLKSLSEEQKEQLRQAYIESNDTESIDILNNINNIDTSKSFLDVIFKLFVFCTKGEVNYNDGFMIYQNDNLYKINKDNFEEFREIVMLKNLLFAPPTSPNMFGMQAIERAIKATFGENDASLASICSVVVCNSGVTDKEIQNYSYYRLMYDFTIINRQHGNIFSFMLRSQGCDKANIDNLGDVVELNTNPYENLLSKHKVSTKL